MFMSCQRIDSGREWPEAINPRILKIIAGFGWWASSLKNARRGLKGYDAGDFLSDYL